MHLRLVCTYSLINKSACNTFKNYNSIRTTLIIFYYFYRLEGNPFCQGPEWQEKYCIQQEINSPYSAQPDSCLHAVCDLLKTSSPNCKWLYPCRNLFLAHSFSDLGKLTYYNILEKCLMTFFTSHQLPIDSVSVSNPTVDLSDNLEFCLVVFPQG